MKNWISKRMFPLLGLGLALQAVAAGAQERISIDRSNLTLSGEESASLDHFLQGLNSVLPGNMMSAFRKPIVIRFQKLGTAGFGVPPCSPEAKSPNYRYGLEPRTFIWNSKHVVQMNEGFLNEIFSGPERATRYQCGHKDLYRLALATAVHEISHHYDYLNVDTSPVAAKLRRDCEIAELNPDSLMADEAKRCRILLRAGTTVSGRAEFLAQMGFSDTPSHVNARSPDRYEFKNERESFAVNMEYFALDPEFACRRPNVYRFLARQFGISEQPKCETNFKIPLSSYNAANWKMVELNPDRIYQIHYLLADSGKDAASSFGHAMLRIVMCGPHTPMGPECLNDVSHHIAVSFRANVRGLGVDKWDGLTGKYVSQLFLIRFMDVITEDAIGQSRRVLSYPLNLDRDQISSMVRQINQEYWEYKNHYYFLTNNCATETLNLIRASLNDHPIAIADRAITPKSLIQTLASLGLLDQSPIEAPHANGRYVFPALEEMVQSSFDTLASVGLPVGVSGLDDLLRRTPSERGEVMDVMIQAHPTQVKVISSNFLAIEMLCRIREFESIQRKAATLTQASDVEGLMKIQDQLLPWSLARGGYGIPIEIEGDVGAQVAQLTAELDKRTKDGLIRLRPQLKAETDLYRDSSALISKLISLMKGSQ